MSCGTDDEWLYLFACFSGGGVHPICLHPQREEKIDSASLLITSPMYSASILLRKAVNQVSLKNSKCPCKNSPGHTFLSHSHFLPAATAFVLTPTPFWKNKDLARKPRGVERVHIILKTLVFTLKCLV